MKWPWIARSAYDVVVQERDRLREQNDQLLDHVTRMDRVEHGKPEIPPKPKPSEPMPRRIRDYIEEWDSEASRKRMESEVWAAYQRVGSWTEVERLLLEDV